MHIGMMCILQQPGHVMESTRMYCNKKYLFAGCSEKCVDLLAFETLIPKSIIQRYISLLLEHRRIILSGPSGTGKTYLTQKLADYIVSL